MTGNDVWAAPVSVPPLRATAVHVWRVPLDVSPARQGELVAVLDPDELARAARFHFERDRRRFVAAHGFLRRILGLYRGVHPASLRFRFNLHGKPALADAGGRDLRFNLAHSGNLALVALTAGREIGVDIELIRPDVVSMDVARQFFARQEVRDLASLPPREQTAAFFRCWTRKEAYIKARGEGLSAPLDSFAVTLRADEPAALLWCAAGEVERSRWSLSTLDVAVGYAAALAVEGHDWIVSRWDADYPGI